MSWDFYPEYVPVAQRRAWAKLEMDELRRQGKTIEPVEIEGRKIARSFWGQAWCEHLESFSDFANRLPRGRTYARNGSVCHLSIRPGRVEAIVSGSELYHLDVGITELSSKSWDSLKQRCAGRVGSMLELLRGNLSDQVMAEVTNRETGLFPTPQEIRFDCSCPDFAVMCKHMAAVLYGIGHRLDSQPELLFTLRGVDPQELIATNIAVPDTDAPADATLAEDQLGDIFGIELDTGEPTSGRRDDASSDGQRKPQKQANKRSSKRARQKRASPKRQADEHLPRIRPTGKSVARLRRRLGCSQADFAQRLGVSPATVSRWEAAPGRLRLTPASWRAIARLHQHTKEPQRP